MNEKKMKIMAAAVKLFANKGSASTSIQEIANESDISKGAFYLHFKSKDELKLTIFKYYLEKIQAGVKKYEAMDLPAREKLIKQLEIYFAEIMAQKEILVLQFREQVLYRTNAVDAYFKKLEKVKYDWYREKFLSIYGDEIVPHLNDMMVLFEGMMHAYIRLMIKSKIKDIDYHALAVFLAKRLDDIVAGMIREGAVIIPEKSLQSNRSEVRESYLKVIDLLEVEISTSNDADLKASVEMLKLEIEKDTPKHFIITGMLANLEKYETLKVYTDQLRDIVAVNGEEF